MKLFIDGKKVESQTDKWINNYNPATNEVISRVPCATPAEMEAAFDSAQKAFPAWKAKSVLSRQQIMFQFRDLIKKHWVREVGVVRQMEDVRMRSYIHFFLNSLKFFVIFTKE